MSTIIAESADAAVELSVSVNKNGGVSGLTIAASVYDSAAATNKWLNMTTGVWQASQDTATMTEVGSLGHYVSECDVSNAVGAHLQAFYEITAGGETGISQDTIILVNTLTSATEAKQDTMQGNVTDVLADTAAGGAGPWTTANVAALALEATLATVEGKVDTVDTNVDAVLVDTGTTIPATLATLATSAALGTVDTVVDAIKVRTDVNATEAKQDIIDTNVDAILVDTGTTIPATLAGLATAAALATVDSEVGVIDGIVDQILVDTGTDIPARFTGIEGATFSGATDSLEAIRDRGDAAWTTGAGGSPITAQEVRDAMKLAPTGGAPAAGSVDEHLDDVLLDTGTTLPATLSTIEGKVDTVDTVVDAVLVDTGTDIPARFDGVEGATFATGTDSLEAIRDRGDAAWTTGAGGSPITAQEVRDAMKLAPTVGAPGAGSIDEHLDTIETDTTTDIPALIAAHEAKTDIVDANVDLVLEDTGTTIPATLAGLSTQATQDTIDANVDAILLDTAQIDSRVDVAVSTRSSHSAPTVPTVGQIADQVWDEASADHLGVGTTGFDQDAAASGGAGLTSQQVRDAMKLAPTVGAPGAGSVDEHLDNMPVDVDTELTTQHGVGAWNGVGGGGITAQQVRDAMKLAPTVGAPAAGSVDEHLDDVLEDTGTTLPATLTTIEGKVDTVDTVVDAVKVRTDVNATEAKQDVIDANVDAVLVDTGTTIPATLTTIEGKVDTVDTVVDAVKVRTDVNATEAKQDVIDANVDAVLVDTGTTLPARFTGIEGAGFLTGTDSLEAIRDRGDAAWITGAGGSPITQQQVRDALLLSPTGGAGSGALASIDDHLEKMEGATFDTATDSNEAIRNRGDAAWTGSGGGLTQQEARDAMQLTATDASPSIDDQIAAVPTVGEIDTELTTQHGIGAWNGVGGGGITQQQVRDAMQLAATDATISIDDKIDALDSAALQALLDQYVSIVERTAPVIVEIPIVTKQQVHVDDLGHVLNVPVMRNGVLADLSTVSSVVFRIQGPESDTVVNPVGAVGTGSEVTWTSDATVFTRRGRWLVSALVTWADGAAQWTNTYDVDVEPALPYL